jgi:hypothetical protein
MYRGLWDAVFLGRAHSDVDSEEFNDGCRRSFFLVALERAGSLSKKQAAVRRRKARVDAVAPIVGVLSCHRRCVTAAITWRYPQPFGC